MVKLLDELLCSFIKDLRGDLLGLLAERGVDGFVCEVLEVCAGPLVQLVCELGQETVGTGMVLSVEVVLEDLKPVTCARKGNFDLEVEPTSSKQ